MSDPPYPPALPRPLRRGPAATQGWDRWHIVVALLRSPEREAGRLVALLEKLPAARRVHRCGDDVKRRQMRRA